MIPSPNSKVLEILAEHASPGSSHRVFHYLYFPDRAKSASAAKELQTLNFETEEKPAAQGTDWLVLAWQELVPTENTIEKLWSAMEEFAEGAGGAYDGYEVEIRQN